MPPCDEVGDGPAVLQLRKWSTSGFKLELSEFCEAFISPTKELLLLLSYHSEALLLPLLAGEISSSKKDGSVKHNIEELEKSSSLPIGSAEQTDICLLDPSGNVACSSKPVDAVSDSAPASCCYPVISNVKSLAWGHWGDTYGDFKDHGFRELLFISDCNNIIVHAFRYRDVNSQVIESAPADGSVHGKWIEWQPTCCTDANEHFPSHADRLDETGSTTGIKGRLNAGVGHASHRSSISTPTKWFRTYLTEVSAIESGGNFLVKFPAKASIPHSAEVVSFSIFESTLTFLESFSCYSQKENQDSGSVSGLVGSVLSSGGTPVMSSLDHEAGHAGISYKCSKLFSSSLHHLIGLVLTYSDGEFIKTSEESLLNVKRTLVVVVMPHEWGIQWVCSVNPNALYPGPGPGPGWADFQFSENLLVCLNTTGLISIWDAKTGSSVTCLDVLESCGLISKNDFGLSESFLASEKDSCSSEQEENDISKVKRSETCSTGSVPSRKFRRLLACSHSLLLASIDEHGIMYVLNGDDYISENRSALEEYKAPPRDSNLGMLEAWKIAGQEIGSRKVLSDLKNIKYFCGSGTAVGGFSNETHHKDGILRKRGKRYTEGKRGQMNTSLNCVSMFSWRKGAPVPHLETRKSTTAMRRIFLPLDRSSKKEFIFLSPFGITKLMRSCNKKEEKYCSIVHTHLHVGSPFVQEQEFNTCLPSQKFSSLTKECTLVGESIGCLFQGCLYMVTADGLSVILPAVSISSGMLSIDTLRYWQPSSVSECKNQVNIFSYLNDSKGTWRPWQVEVLDRVLLYEGPEEAEELCSRNNWDLKVARLRRMQLALQYLKFDEIEKSLDMLAQVNLAEEGVLRLLFTSLYQILSKGNDSETALALRLLSLSACFATKMVRKYGLEKHKKDDDLSSNKKSLRISYLQTALQKHDSLEISNSIRLYEMAHFLEVIRNLQSRLTAKGRRPGHVLVLDGREASNLVDGDELRDDSPLPIVEADGSSNLLDNLDVQTIPESDFHSSEFNMDNNIEDLALAPTEFSTHAVELLELDGSQRRKLIAVENSRDMITRWEIDHLDLRMVVKDALQTGRLPLAVLQLHMQRQKESVAEDSHATFNEVRKVGRAVAYDLFLKGDIGLAVATLHRLGEDIETSLRDLLFGTVRRSLRARIVEEMKAHGYLRTHELHKLEKLSVIERVYPSNSFWVTFLGRQKETSDAASSSNVPEANSLKVTLHLCDNLTFECGDIDGVISGLWASVDNDSSLSEICEDNGLAGYWACAFMWSNAWDDRTMERIVLDQPFHMGVHVPWETQLEYYMLHNDLEEVYKLLDVIPSSSLYETALEVNLDVSHSPGKAPSNLKYLTHDLYMSSSEELEPVCMTVPNIKSFNFSAANRCSSWLKMHVERQLARKYIFIQEYWGSTTEIVVLIARAGLLMSPKVTAKDEYSEGYSTSELTKIGEQVNENTAEAFHKLLIRYCAQYNLPSLLDLYLDHMDLIKEENTLSSLLDAAGDCQWVKWLLFSRIKGHEYEASFSNARSNLTHHTNRGSKLSSYDVDDIIHTVDDVAEGGGEMAALATLMYATAPLQKCVCPGSVKQYCNLSSQCTLENIRPGLQQFPTLWRTLVMSCFGQDLNGCSLYSAASNVYGRSALSEYLNWRDNIFSSAGGDTSLTQMLPCWFSKSIRQLLRLFVQGPLGWHALSGEIPGEHVLDRDSRYALNANRNATFSAISWESSIQKCIEEELYSSVEDNAFGVEHHLHRGRALAAFDNLLGKRAQKLKSTQELSGQTNVQSDVQMILAPLTQSEESLLSSVVPLAITHFEDSVLVASCAFLLELCGLSASMLRVDIAALHRISSYYSSVDYNSLNEFSSPKVYPMHAVSNEADLSMSLARALADECLHIDQHKALKQKHATDNVSMRKQPSHALMTVLHHLERASLPVIEEGGTCGSWLSNGIGDGAEFRSHQRDASQHWKLASTFCQMHNLPLSMKYLALLANDNDWVGFLTEAQTEGFSMDMVLQVAAKEFSDPRLKTHILTVLRSMQSPKKKTDLSMDASASERGCAMSFLNECKTTSPVELFGIISECEKQKNPGEALLMKAKDLRWPLLGIIASCFSDVPPLSCLTVWLEITAARETSSIQVNDVYTKITASVGAAVEAINALPTGSRTLQYRYNRRNPKRRRLLETESWNLTTEPSCMSPRTSSPSVVPIVQEIASEDEKKRTVTEQMKMPNDVDEGLASLANMVAVLCEQHLFLPLLRAFEMFLPSCSLLPFVRSLQAFSQMRLSEAAAHLASFSVRIKEESFLGQLSNARDTQIKTTWISSTAVKAADALLSTCPSAYERRCLLQLLAAADFGDGGFTSTRFRRLYWKINLAEPSLRKDDEVYLGNEILDDASLLTALEKNGQWEKARNWARQLESSGSSWKFAVHHVTEAQAEAMVTEWKEFLWDVPDERSAVWNHCHVLFLRYSFPPLQAGLFFLKHADAIEKEIPARELHEILLLSLQWLSGTVSQCNPVYPLYLLREIETRVWLLAVESEAQSKVDGDFTSSNSTQNLISGNSASIIDQTASIITKMDNHIHSMRCRTSEKNGIKDNTHNRNFQASDYHNSSAMANSTRTKRRAKTYLPLRKPVIDIVDSNNDTDDYMSSPHSLKPIDGFPKNTHSQEENVKIEASVSGWEEKVRPAELERAVLSLLEFGQITAAKQLQQKLSPMHVPAELVLVDAALKLAALSSSSSNGEISDLEFDEEVLSVIWPDNAPGRDHMVDPFQAMEYIAAKCGHGCGRGICRRIIAVVKAAKVLGVSFSEAFEKQPIELLQLLSLKAQDSLEEAKLLVQTHTMPSSSIARILAESFLKGLLAAHRGGYMDSQKEEGPAPLLWRFSDFLKWAELCPSEQEIGHALMRLVMTGQQEIPHACEVELLILSDHFYKSSSCLDGVDVLVALAANRVESYVLEGDFSCLARLITGVSNFHALNFILDILIENGQLELLLQKSSTAETAASTAEAVRGFRMAVLTSLKLFNPHDLDAFAMVYNHFDMKHETAALLESRSQQCIRQWFMRRYKDQQTEDLLESMHYLIEAAEVHSTIDAGNKAHHACARASLLSLQIRIPDVQWLDLSETNARRALVEQSRFQEALIVAEAYNLNQPGEWALVLWNQMLKPDLVEQFVVEFVAVLPLQPSMLLELARFYRAEVAARGDQSHFSVWLSPGGLPAEWVKHLGRSFRSLLKRTRDLRVRVQLATIATGFTDVVNSCMKVLDKVPDNAGPLILRKGHGGAYVPLM